MTKVIKRDCSEVNFDKSKISTAILKAMKNGSGIVKPKIAEDIADEIENECKDKDEVSILKVKKSHLVLDSNSTYSSFLNFLSEYNSNLFVCDFINGDYFFLTDIHLVVE